MRREELPDKERKNLETLAEITCKDGIIDRNGLYSFATYVKRLYYCNYEVETWDLAVAKFYKMLIVQERGRS